MDEFDMSANESADELDMGSKEKRTIKDDF